MRHMRLRFILTYIRFDTRSKPLYSLTFDIFSDNTPEILDVKLKLATPESAIPTKLSYGPKRQNDCAPSPLGERRRTSRQCRMTVVRINSSISYRPPTLFRIIATAVIPTHITAVHALARDPRAPARLEHSKPNDARTPTTYVSDVRGTLVLDRAAWWESRRANPCGSVVRRVESWSRDWRRASASSFPAEMQPGDAVARRLSWCCRLCLFCAPPLSIFLSFSLPVLLVSHRADSLSPSLSLPAPLSFSLCIHISPSLSLFLCRLPDSVMPPFCSLACEDTSLILCRQASLHLPACLLAYLPTALLRTPEPASPFPFSRTLPASKVPYNSEWDAGHRGSRSVGSRKYRGSNHYLATAPYIRVLYKALGSKCRLRPAEHSYCSRRDVIWLARLWNQLDVLLGTRCSVERNNIWTRRCDNHCTGIHRHTEPRLQNKATFIVCCAAR